MTYYDSIADGYDELYGAEQLEKYRALDSLQLIDPEDTILDLGHGTGMICEALPNEITGLDRSARLLARSHARTLVHDLDEPLPFSDTSFDWVVSFTVLHHVRDPRALLDEARRIARRGAAVSISRSLSSYATLAPLFVGWASHRAGVDTLFIWLRNETNIKKRMRE